MKQVHVECYPDEHLVVRLGFQKKVITHHQGRSRIFTKLSKTKNELALVDEDPESGRNNHEKSLKVIEEFEGIKYLKDHYGNKVCMLAGKLEDWIISQCKRSKIQLSGFGLPDKADDLHDVINNKLESFGKLIDKLIESKNPGILKLKEWLK